MEISTRFADLSFVRRALIVAKYHKLGIVYESSDGEIQFHISILRTQEIREIVYECNYTNHEKDWNETK